MSVNVADLYSALRDYRDTIGHDLLSPRGQGIFDKHYSAASKFVGIDHDPETGKLFITHSHAKLPYENKHIIQVEHDSGDPTTLTVSHLMPYTSIIEGAKEPINHGLADYGSWEPEHLVGGHPDRQRMGVWNTAAHFDYPDPSNQPHDYEMEKLFGEYAPYSKLHQGGIHDIIKEMMGKPVLGGVTVFDGSNTKLRPRKPISRRPMSKNEMNEYFSSDNDMQFHHPPHLLNVYNRGRSTSHVLNLNTEELTEGAVEGKKGWLM